MSTSSGKRSFSSQRLVKTYLGNDDGSMPQQSYCYARRQGQNWGTALKFNAKAKDFVLKTNVELDFLANFNKIVLY